MRQGRKAWTGADDDALAAMWRSGISLDEIVEVTGRSKAALWTRASRIGLLAARSIGPSYCERIVERAREG
ncbi:hypothetical protein SAMN06297251_10468 [Fulvimarina manganoxydans]|uniref:GcrA cell cycle regulator n=1 Tax=Fulvimarina manganoxydans TaxID=937218 RepID=A0A1W2ACW8_9HYPH|nr:hypothetical protein [Fulvimarina manganoxydans]SMC58332.1 hypothetical protein SAMN06297251_10468 [Fulvimarina manganoxydans]